MRCVGYTPSAEALEAISSMVDRLREINPELIYGELVLQGIFCVLFLTSACSSGYRLWR